MDRAKLEALEYRDEQEYKKLRPTNKHLKEVAYAKSQPTEQTSATATGDDAALSEKQRKIAELK